MESSREGLIGKYFVVASLHSSLVAIWLLVMSLMGIVFIDTSGSYLVDVMRTCL